MCFTIKAIWNNGNRNITQREDQSFVYEFVYEKIRLFIAVKFLVRKIILKWLKKIDSSE